MRTASYLLFFLCAACIAKQIVYVGTYTSEMGGSGQGIYAFALSKGKLTPLNNGKPTVTPSPSFLAVDPSKTHLYAVNEGDVSTVTSYKIAASYALTQLNSQKTSGQYGCHVITDNTGNYVFAANYGTGNVAVFSSTNGNLSPAIQVIQHSGSFDPHAHEVVVGPDNDYVFAVDLGVSKVYQYELTKTTNKTKPPLVPNQKAPFLQLGDETGPRHMVIHTSKKYAYIISEYANTVTACSLENGALMPFQSISTLPPDFNEWSACAEIVIHPTMPNILYASNRGHDSIAVFTIDPGTGKLENIQIIGSQGVFPRSFAIDATGEYMLIANQKSNTIITLRISDQGRLLETGIETSVPSPVHVLPINF